MENKWCFVPGCKNTSKNAPEKVFVTVPKQKQRKIKWFKAARRDLPTTATVFFCCEDHFKFEEDMRSYIRYKLMGGPIFLKQEVVPHIFDCQQDRKRASSSEDRPLAVKRVRRNIINEIMHGEALTPTISSYNVAFEMTIETQSSSLAKPSTSQVENNETYFVVKPHYPTVSSLSEEKCLVHKPSHRDIAVQARPSFRNKYVACKIDSLQDAASPPDKFIILEDMSTSQIKCIKIATKQPAIEIISSSDEEISQSNT